MGTRSGGDCSSTVGGQESKLMKIDFTEEQEMLRAAAREFLEKECTEAVVKAVEAGRSGYSPDLWRKIADLGWLGLVFPPQFGGSGMSLADLAVLCEELGRAMFPGPFVPTVVLGGLTVLAAGGDEQKQRWLARIIEGKELISLAMNEPESGPAGAEAVSVRAARGPGGFVLDGTVLFAQDAAAASSFLVPARTEPGITLFLVDAAAKGVTVTRLASTAGDSPCEVVFEGAQVTGAEALGEIDRGWDALARSLQVAAVMSAAQMLGAGEGMLKAAADDYATRRQSGEPEDKYTEEYLSKLRSDLEACRPAVYGAARNLTAGQSVDFDSAVVKDWREYARD